ncbi:hypothetical protein O3G_MSEX013967 [Manduca sexta]|nr:hypothetical protein O3G_MSEX013967 [Manduca sexta]KAG6463605.1 hypothetical protein O3G_MSEX013967 [Manduca sexta]KAG6463606.1 hypothetical protein O3G_MSEX013967 [Manduca sexta]
MNKQLNNEDIIEILNKLKWLINGLDKRILPQDADTDKVAEKFHPNILHALKQEHEVIINSREIKQTFSRSVGPGVLSTDHGVHTKEPFNAEVAVSSFESNCIDTRESTQETGGDIIMPSAETHAFNDENSSRDNNCRSSGQRENQNDLCDSRDTTDDEDILDLMTYESDHDDEFVTTISSDDHNSSDDIVVTNSMAGEDDASMGNLVTQENRECENSENINPETNLNKLNNQNLHIEDTINDDEYRYCFPYLKTKTCKKPKCKFIHDFPTTEIMHKILKKLYKKPLFDLLTSHSLKRMYGDCFAKAFSQRHDLKNLFTIMMEFLEHSPKVKITDRIINTNLNYFNNYYKNINLTPYKKILLAYVCPEKQLYMVLFERVLRRKINNENDFKSFKRVCLLLTNFIIDNCREVDMSTTEIFMNKICTVQYDQSLTKALINIMRRTSAEIFENPAIQRLEEVIKRNAALYEQYLQLKDAKRKKNDGVKKYNIGSQVQNYVNEVTSTSISNNLQYSSKRNNGAIDITERGISHPIPNGSEDLPDSTVPYKDTDDLTIADYERNSREISNNYYMSGKNYSQDRTWCLFYILDRCNRHNCSYRHGEPDLEEFKKLLNQIKEEKLFTLIKHQPTVNKYGKCLAQKFYEQKSTKLLVMLAVECLILADIIPDIKTDVINVTLRYFNRPEIDVCLCEELLNKKIQTKSVQSLLLKQLLSNDTLSESTNALIFLINSISASNETFGYYAAESILERVCSSYNINLARAFMNVIRLTYPKILKHSLISRFEELLATDKDLLEQYKVLKTANNNGDVDTRRIANETVSTSNVNTDIVTQKRRRSTDETSLKANSTHPKPAASIKRRRFTNHNLVAQTPEPSPVIPPLPHRKPIKIFPCHWAPLIGTSSSKPERSQQRNGQADSP